MNIFPAESCVEDTLLRDNYEVLVLDQHAELAFYRTISLN
jgi:hypothetical protein